MGDVFVLLWSCCDVQKQSQMSGDGRQQANEHGPALMLWRARLSSIR